VLVEVDVDVAPGRELVLEEAVVEVLTVVDVIVTPKHSLNSAQSPIP
jgi:hypothetical protein